MGEVDEALREVGRHDRAGAACLPADVAAIKGFEISHMNQCPLFLCFHSLYDLYNVKFVFQMMSLR